MARSATAESPAEALDYAHAALILSAFALFASRNLVHYPIALMFVLGSIGMLRTRPFTTPAARRLLALFACIWVPMVLALPDAVHLPRSTETALLYAHFLPVAWYVQQACTRPAVLRLVTHGVVVLVLFVTFDAFAQLIWGVNLFGYPYDGQILKGVFHPKQRLGLFLAVFTPLCVDVTRRGWGEFPRLWLLHIPLLIVILMSLKRSAWIMLAVALLGYALAFTGRHGWRVPALRARHGLLALAVLALVAGAVALHPALRSQMATSAGLFAGEPAAFDRASGYRLTLWRTGLDMFTDNWINGVGPRGYRYAYAEHAAADDFWMERSGGRGQTHPHLLVLEVAVECGAIGLLGLALFYVLLLAALGRLRQLPFAPVWLLCALVAWFPANAHLAFYGSYWSTLAWLLLGIGLAGSAPPALSAAVRDAACGVPDAPRA